MHSCSVWVQTWATPLLAPCITVPPSASPVMVSPVTAWMTFGPVMNIWLTLSVMNMKSVMPGEYTAPPAQGPRIIDICGMRPEAFTLR